MTYRNLVELHRCQAEQLGSSKPALRYKKDGAWHSISWPDYRAEATACAAALIDAGIQPGDRVGILAENSVQWLIADIGIMAAGGVNVPPHAPLTARQVHFQLDDAGVRWVFVSTQDQLDKIIRIRSELPKLKGIVAFDSKATGGDVISWDRFLQRGRELLPRLAAEITRRERELVPDDLATIIYTSGTTGNPKGVMLSHGNLVSNTLATHEAFPRQPDSVLLTWLPFSHIYARTVDHYGTIVGGVTACLAESPETVVQNLAEIHPTHMSSVPRFYEKVLTAVSPLGPEQSKKALRGIFGPRVDFLSSGGAPLSRPVADAYQAAGLLVLQGYGLTESSPVITFNRKDSYKLGTVGQPIPGVEVKIAPDGEVLTRGPHVMKGYWNNAQATAESLQNGWLHTGDLGSIDSDGFLSITGRKKELLVLSNGKKVVPTFIEGLLVADDCIDQAVVCGEARPFLTALVVPNWDNLKKALGAGGVSLDGKSPEELAGASSVREFLQQQMRSALADVSNYEQVKKFLVLPRPLTVAAEELTVSLKVRRNVVLGRYAGQLETLYREREDSLAEVG
jgi:long-chain acyl-CoA synthetase